ncbi:hypothetical protein O181_017567 [Austropuccinia psidii MF-1]|uniref:Uncharacterized protein n=1 Tax=Austropuccinia psidii MF-1 TaxID=1389203 RepID=A0A9Q3GSP5_9BASI|nr:hypothetical protein [Austropuccinia psidii MF-1]
MLCGQQPCPAPEEPWFGSLEGLSSPASTQMPVGVVSSIDPAMVKLPLFAYRVHGPKLSNSSCPVATTVIGGSNLNQIGFGA